MKTLLLVVLALTLLGCTHTVSIEAFGPAGSPVMRANYSGGPLSVIGEQTLYMQFAASDQGTTGTLAIARDKETMNNVLLGALGVAAGYMAAGGMAAP